MNQEDPWSQYQSVGSPSRTNATSAHQMNPEDPWSQYESAQPEKDSTTKNVLRKGIQGIKGYARTNPAGLAYDIGTTAMQLGAGEALAELDELEERLPHLRKMFPDMGLPEHVDREKYLEAVKNASDYVPTIENLSKWGEEATGIPLEARDVFDRLLGLAGMSAGAQPGSIAKKALAGVTAPIVSGSAQAVGVPEALADIGGLMTGHATAGIIPSISRAKKPSGMTIRRFESLKKPTTISPGVADTIKNKVEGEFRTISDKILSDRNQIYKDMKVNPSYFDELDQQFQKVASLSEEIPTELSPYDLKQSLFKRANLKNTKGISPSESEREFQKEIQRTAKGINDRKFHKASDYVEQYRKNNRELKRYYEPGKSKAYNEAKKEALLEYNRAIADEFEKNFPESEFVKLFKETNATNRVAKDVERVNEFVNELTEGKIDFKKGHKFFSDTYTKNSFKRVLGEDGFKEYEILMKDLLSLEQPMSYIKKADAAGFWDLAKQAVPYLVNPKLGVFTSGYRVYKQAMNHLLSHPRLIPVWRRGIQEMKSGKYAAAQKTFEFLNREINSVVDTPKEEANISERGEDKSQ